MVASLYRICTFLYVVMLALRWQIKTKRVSLELNITGFIYHKMSCFTTYNTDNTTGCIILKWNSNPALTYKARHGALQANRYSFVTILSCLYIQLVRPFPVIVSYWTCVSTCPPCDIHPHAWLLFLVEDCAVVQFTISFVIALLLIFCLSLLYYCRGVGKQASRKYRTKCKHCSF